MLIAPMGVLRRILLTVFCIMLALSPALRAVEPFPTRLADDTFWDLVADSSEAGGDFLSENFVSNELGYQYVIPPALEKIQLGGVYLGVGPEQNFTYLAAFHPSVAFIVDIRRQNLIEHLLYKALFELSADREEFVSRLFARRLPPDPGHEPAANALFTTLAGVQQDPGFYRENLDAIKNVLLVQHHFGLSKEDETTLEHVYREFADRGADTRYSVSNLALIQRVQTSDVTTVITGPNSPGPLVFGTPFPSYSDLMKATDASGKNWSYLATEANYQVVREMQRKNLVVPLVGDFAGPKAIRAVGKYLRQHDSTVSLFYISNVEQYLVPTPKLQSFYGNVAELPLNSSGIFIRSIQGQGAQPGVAQSSISSIQKVMDAVLAGEAQNAYDIFRMTN